jgi:hypothetical protein
MKKRFPRKLSLSPMQREIVWILEEAGAESIPTVLNTLQAHFSDHTPDELLIVAEEAIRKLFDMGFVSFSRDYEKPNLNYVPVSGEEASNLLSLAGYIHFSKQRRQWEWDDVRGGPYKISLEITQNGMEAIRT